MTLSIAKTKTFIRYIAACLSALVIGVLFGVSSPARATPRTLPLRGADQHVAATTTLAAKVTAFAQAPGAVTNAIALTERRRHA